LALKIIRNFENSPSSNSIP